jgi:hypothetical protein
MHIGGRERLQNNFKYTSLVLCPQKIHVQKVPSTHIKSSLSKLGAYWTFHNAPQHWPNTRKDGPMSMEPQLHEAAWKVGDPRSWPWVLCE